MWSNNSQTHSVYADFDHDFPIGTMELCDIAEYVFYVMGLHLVFYPNDRLHFERAVELDKTTETVSHLKVINK